MWRQPGVIFPQDRLICFTLQLLPNLLVWLDTTSRTGRARTLILWMNLCILLATSCFLETELHKLMGHQTSYKQQAKETVLKSFAALIAIKPALQQTVCCG